MNKYKYILIAGLIFFASCEENEFLKENPKDTIYAENLLQNYDGFVNIMNGIYAWVRSEKSRFQPSGGIPITRSTCWTSGVDNAFMNNGHSKMTWLNWPTNTNAELEVWEDMFEWLYKIINTTNMVIERAENPDIDWQGGSPEADEAKKNLIIAQAKVVRAWGYRHLSYSWGDVPLSLKEISGETYRNDWERTPLSEVRAQMIKDLEFAVANLEMKYDNPTTANAAVAGHYLAETYLAVGEYSKAEAAARAVCESTQYRLMTERFGVSASEPGVPFMDLFKNPLPASGNEEALWVFLNTEPENAAYGVENGSYLFNTWQTYYSKHSAIKVLDLNVFYTYNGGRGAGRNSITQAALSWYEPQDDRFSEYAIKKTLVMPDENGDLQVVLTTSTNHTITPGKYDLDHYSWPSTRKWEYVHPNPEQANSRDLYNPIMFLRLAETYLVLAEALHKQGKNAEAAIWINKVRERSNASPISAGDVTIDFILDERSRELITEEHRRHTLIRTGKLVERIQLYNDFAGPTIADAPILFPIPQTVIDANTGRVMAQNPGYN